MRYIVIIFLALLVACQTPSSAAQIAKADTRHDNLADDHSKVVAPEPSATSETSEAARISLKDAKQDFDDETAIFIDARSKYSFDKEHISGSINIPVGEVETRYTEIPKDKKIIVYCS